MIPTKNNKENKIYSYINTRDVSLYLLNDYDQLTKVDIKVGEDKLVNVIKSIINKLTISNDATIPKVFTQIIPNNIKVDDVLVEEGIAKINFNEDFLKIKDDEIIKIIEAITYSLLELKEINGVSIYVNHENISNLFNKDIPNIITKEYGINKRNELKSFNDISKVTIFYIDNVDDDHYFVPITKYVNDNREKIKIIIDELSSNYIYESNLVSLLNKNIKLLNYEIKNDVMTLDFNNSIFLENNEILEEVIYSISYSVFANYDVENVVFKVNGENFIEKKLKSYWIIDQFAV